MRGALAASTLLSGVLLGLASGGPGESGEPGGSVAATDPGDDVCADCHPSVVSSWATTGMARALDQLRPGELDGLVPVLEEPSGLTYALEEEGGRARIVEQHANGEALFTLAAEHDDDLRPALFHLAVEQGWTLTELHQDHVNLEDVFRQLTAT